MFLLSKKNYVQRKYIYIHRAGEMDFKVEGAWNTDKDCRPPWLADQKSFSILDSLEWLKQ